MPNMRWLMKYISANKGVYLIGLAMVIITALLSTVMTGIQKFIIDDVLVEQQYELLVPYILLLGASVLGFNILMPASNIMMMRNRYRILLRMGKDYLNSLHRMSAAAIHHMRTGEVVNNFITDTDLIGNMLAYHASWIIMHAATAIILIGALAYFSPITLFAILLVSVIYVLMYQYFGKKTFSVFSETNKSRSRLMTHVQESISATREVLAFEQRKQERERLNSLFMDYIDKSMQEVKINNRQLLTSEPFKWICQLIVLGYGGYAVMTGSMTIGTLVVTFQFATRLLFALHQCFVMCTEFRGRMSNVQRLRDALNGEILEEGTMEWNRRIETLQLSNVSFRYQDDREWVLQDLDLDFPIGKKVAIVGTSGGGKSTISQLLVRFYDPTFGDVVVNDIPLSNLTRASWSHKVRVVFQEPYLFPDTIRSNILLGRDLSEDQLKEACHMACIEEFVSEFSLGLDTETGERGIILSGGQRQRIAIARAILEQPEILILDEATSSLDVETERQLMTNLDRVRSGLTTIIIAHRLSTIVNADVIYVVDQGRVVEKGMHTELMQLGGVYSSLYLNG